MELDYAPLSLLGGNTALQSLISQRAHKLLGKVIGFLWLWSDTKHSAPLIYCAYLFLVQDTYCEAPDYLVDWHFTLPSMCPFRNMYFAPETSMSSKYKHQLAQNVLLARTKFAFLKIDQLISKAALLEVS